MSSLSKFSPENKVAYIAPSEKRVPPRDAPPAYLLSPLVTRCSTGEARVSDTATRQVYLSQKACLALRYRMDCNVIDATY
ncbi:hypothetical protein SKAU_G00320490 [Synaphobranchus kaupii]|uniref:Uncharacterized protein n=1 Tax=Synaphobranchus kaupii TaxID=118154 RepID=A0A9Q1IJQ8_SYNKA|nr:hypothetical protein SKAU_G00320490 [Synaphobranchus kaupii]